MSVLNLKSSIFELPSQGLAYDQELVPLIEGTSVKLRPFVAGDQRYLAKSPDAYAGYVALLSRILVEPLKISYSELLVSDVIAILFMARMESLGPLYKVQCECTNCGEAQTTELNLAELDVKMSEDIEPTYEADGLLVELNGVPVKYHLPRMKDEKQITILTTTLKNKKQLMSAELDRFYIRLAQLIDDVGEKESASFSEKFKFICDLPIGEFQYFGQELTDKDTGLQGEATIACVKCQSDVKAQLGLTPEFFRATPRRSTEHA